jgi:hypothetical protein
MMWLAVVLNAIAIALLIGLLVLHVREYGWGRKDKDDE